MENTVRKAYVAGKFYPSSPAEIIGQFEKFRSREKPSVRYKLSGKNIFGAVLPHAGHIFSGYQAIHFFEILSSGKQDVDTFVIVHPVHRGGDLDFASDPHDFWETPLGKIKVDQDFIQEAGFETSGSFHQWEHSAEVLVPFIQEYYGTDVSIVPVGVGWQHPESASKIADSVLRAETATGRKICFLASSDFSHFLDPVTGRKKDQLVLDQILAMDPEKVYRTVRKENISVCGYGPIMSLMYYAMKKFPKVKAEVLSRGHSGEIYPSDSVVDYISILFYSRS